jgi:hypothetical protein
MRRLRTPANEGKMLLGSLASRWMRANWGWFAFVLVFASSTSLLLTEDALLWNAAAPNDVTAGSASSAATTNCRTR